jgi:hypothetical protein
MADRPIPSDIRDRAGGGPRNCALLRIVPGQPELPALARRALDFFRRELEPCGVQVRAEIVAWPGGGPGDLGFCLTWTRSGKA